ncbi:unnamed protein product [Amoebophrya sp. A25]|nr:unnamed protein product [Amoebophrya sp. A25]|eukprot:GSA25T00000826001.1
MLNVTCTWRNVTDETLLSEIFGTSLGTEFRMDPLLTYLQPTTSTTTIAPSNATNLRRELRSPAGNDHDNQYNNLGSHTLEDRNLDGRSRLERRRLFDRGSEQTEDGSSRDRPSRGASDASASSPHDRTQDARRRLGGSGDAEASSRGNGKKNHDHVGTTSISSSGVDQSSYLPSSLIQSALSDSASYLLDFSPVQSPWVMLMTGEVIPQHRTRILRVLQNELTAFDWMPFDLPAGVELPMSPGPLQTHRPARKLTMMEELARMSPGDRQLRLAEIREHSLRPHAHLVRRHLSDEAAYRMVKEGRADASFRPQEWRHLHEQSMVRWTEIAAERQHLEIEPSGSAARLSTTWGATGELEVIGSSSSSSWQWQMNDNVNGAAGNSGSLRALQANPTNATSSNATTSMVASQPTTTTTTTPFPGASYQSVTGHPSYDVGKIYEWLNPRLHAAQALGKEAVAIEGTDYPLRSFRCFGPDGFVPSTTTSTTTVYVPPPPTPSSSAVTLPGGAVSGASIAVLPRRGLIQGGHQSSEWYHDTTGSSRSSSSSEWYHGTTDGTSFETQSSISLRELERLMDASRTPSTSSDSEFIPPGQQPSNEHNHRRRQEQAESRRHDWGNRNAKTTGLEGANDFIAEQMSSYNGEMSQDHVMSYRELGDKLYQNAIGKGSRSSLGDRHPYHDTGDMAGRQRFSSRHRTIEEAAYHQRQHARSTGRHVDSTNHIGHTASRSSRGLRSTSAYPPFSDFAPESRDSTDEAGRSLQVLPNSNEVDTIGITTQYGGTMWPLPHEAGYYVNASTPFCLMEECIEDVDPNAPPPVRPSTMAECAALTCAQCASFTNMTCTVCLAYTLGRSEYFCMHNENACADMRYARPFTDMVEINGKCPDQELILSQGDNMLGVIIRNDTNVTAPKQWTNPFQPDLLGPKYLPYIVGGISAPFAVFTIFFIYGRYRKMIERMKTFNEDGMANPEVATGDFTKLKRFFVEFLEDFLEKSKKAWDDELADLKEFANRNEKCRKQLSTYRRTLKFRRENMIGAKHLNLIAKYMRVMPYLCLHLHCDWYEADEKTLAALCNVIRLSFSQESLRLYKIKCRVTFETDVLKFPPTMNAAGRSSVDDIAELLFFNPTVNRLKVMNPADIRLEKERLGRNAWHRVVYRKYIKPILFPPKKSRSAYQSVAPEMLDGGPILDKDGNEILALDDGSGVYGTTISPADQPVGEIYEEQRGRREKPGGGILSAIVVGQKPWDAVDLYKLRQITGGRVDTKEMNFGLIGSCCYLGALKALRNLRVLRLRDCNLNDGVTDTLIKLLQRCKLSQLVLSNNYFGDVLMKKMATYFEDRESSEDLQLFQVDKNLIRGRGYKEWRSDDYDEQITIKELVIGTEFFGNPLMGDSGVTNLVRALQFEIEQFSSGPVEEDEEEVLEKALPPAQRMMMRLAKRQEKFSDGISGAIRKRTPPEVLARRKALENSEAASMKRPVKWKFKCLRILRLCHCRMTVTGTKAVANYVCHASSLPLKILALDGNAVKDDGLEFLMKAFCQRLKIRQGGAHAAVAAEAKKVVTDLDDIDEDEEKKMDEENEDKEFEQEAAGAVSMLDMDITEEYVLHQCERKAVGAEPVLEELSLNDCLVTDKSLNMLMIFVRTERLDLVRLGGQNPMSVDMRQDIHKHNMEVVRVRNLERGFVTTKVPVLF